MNNHNIVYIIDDDNEMRESLRWLFESMNIHVQTYKDGITFLESYHTNLKGCLIIDVRMPIMNGFDLLEHLKLRGNRLPILMITAHGDVPMAVRAMKNGVSDFLTKPFNDQYLLDQVQRCFIQLPNANNEHIADDVANRYATLTLREKQVFKLVTNGKLNKQISSELDITVSTVEAHRASMMRKMQAKTLVQLVKYETLLQKMQSVLI